MKRERLPNPLPRLTEAQFCACITRVSQIRAGGVATYAVLVLGFDPTEVAPKFGITIHYLREAIRAVLLKHKQICEAYAEWDGALLPMTEKQFYCCLTRLNRWESDSLERLYTYVVLNKEKKGFWHHQDRHTSLILSRHIQYLLAYTDLQPEDIRHA